MLLSDRSCSNSPLGVVKFLDGLRSLFPVILIVPWTFILLFIVGCSEPQPLIPSQVAKSNSTTGINHDSVPVQTSRELRVPTSIKFDACDLFPEFRFENGAQYPSRSIIETLGGGVAAIDFDMDGWPDLCFPGGGGFLSGHSTMKISSPGVSLFRNGQEPDGSWRSVRDEAGLGEGDLLSLGVAAADFNNDGFTDLFLTGYGPVKLYQNQGDGTFFECAFALGLEDQGFTTSAAWGDLNADGAIDLYVCHYVVWSFDAERNCQTQKKQATEICGPKNFLAESDHVFLSNGDSTFQNRTKESGLQPGGKGLGVVIGDIDLDGDADIYVANDTTANFLYLNDGFGHLEEVAALHGAAFDDSGRPTGSMGVSLADYDNDGLPELWTTNFEYEALMLLRNMGGAQFHSVSKLAGVTTMHGEYVSWGTAFADFDGDGDLDIVVANGHLPDYVPSERLEQYPFLLVNDGHRRYSFALSASHSYFGQLHSGRGLAVIDFNRDGKVDLAISHLSEPARLLLNRTNMPCSTLQVTLAGRGSNRDGLGTIAVLETSAGVQTRQLSGGGSYLSTSEKVLHWGLPPGVTLRKLTLTWPSGHQQVLDRLPQPTADAMALRMTIIEP